MIAKANIKLGKVAYQFEIDEKDEMDTLHKIIVLTNPRRVCNECKNDDRNLMYFTTNKDKEGNTYINVKCAKCQARSKLGLYKAGGYFWHDFEIYKPTKDKNE
jgi:hypothetical protein